MKADPCKARGEVKRKIAVAGSCRGFESSSLRGFFREPTLNVWCITQKDSWWGYWWSLNSILEIKLDTIYSCECSYIYLHIYFSFIFLLWTKNQKNYRQGYSEMEELNPVLHPRGMGKYGKTLIWHYQRIKSNLFMSPHT